jgi:catechol 2,3-dioxygenase-like lactoylglutathione lyase family enzyme
VNLVDLSSPESSPGHSPQAGSPLVAPSLVPELLVADLAVSLRFWVGLCGFRVVYGRPEQGFAYLDRAGAHVMLEQIGVGRNWVSGALERPLGRGINFQITVESIAPLVEALADEGWPLFMAPEEKWYQTETSPIGVKQFLVQDPDGYLLRFSEPLPSDGAAADNSHQKFSTI